MVARIPQRPRSRLVWGIVSLVSVGVGVGIWGALSNHNTEAMMTQTGQVSVSKDTSVSEWSPQASQYFTPTDPIIITSNTAFLQAVSDYGWTGSGTSGSPYIIERLRIVGNSSIPKLLMLRDVSYYIRIRDCYLEGGQIGVYLENINSAQIFNITTIGQQETGIVFQTVPYSRIENCTVGPGRQGISISASSFSRIQGNRIEN